MNHIPQSGLILVKVAMFNLFSRDFTTPIEQNRPAKEKMPGPITFQNGSVDPQTSLGPVFLKPISFQKMFVESLLELFIILAAPGFLLPGEFLTL